MILTENIMIIVHKISFYSMFTINIQLDAGVS